jgi:hypothetical protein
MRPVAGRMLDLSSIPNPVIYRTLLSMDRESQACMAEMKTAAVNTFLHTSSKCDKFNADYGQVINIIFRALYILCICNSVCIKHRRETRQFKVDTFYFCNILSLIYLSSN